MTDYIKYIEQTLHLTAKVEPYTHDEDMPFYLKTGYTLYLLSLKGVKCILAKPKELQNLTAMRKHCGQIRKITGLECVLCLEKVRTYTKEKMISEAIPFIIMGQQIYMPFLGLVLTNRQDRELPQVKKISYSTQKLLLMALYKGWKNKKVIDAATDLGISSMTVSRCFDELEAMGLPLIEKSGKVRKFIWKNDSRALWDSVRPLLQNPVMKQYHFGRVISTDTMKLGGLSAICCYSDLADDSHTIYAISKKAVKDLNLDRVPVIPSGESPEITVQIMRYEIDFPDKQAIDPLSAILSLPDDELSDPRVESAVLRILEEHLHG